MNSASAIVTVIGLWLVGVTVVMAITFWIVRGAILSALAEDRRRVARMQAPARPTYEPGGRHWLDGDGR